jgi:multidrug transporter EmrE-like cation transporter
MKFHSLIYIATIQFGFSLLDIFARNSLKEYSTFLTAISGTWFSTWLLLQLCITPFQIKLITNHGIGRGVALMNAFSIIYASIFGVILLNESITLFQCISAVLVVVAVFLLFFQKKVPVLIPANQDVYLATPLLNLENQNHENHKINSYAIHRCCNDADELNQYSFSESNKIVRIGKQRRWRDR